MDGVQGAKELIVVVGTLTGITLLLGGAPLWSILALSATGIVALYFEESVVLLSKGWSYLSRKLERTEDEEDEESES